MYVVKHCQNPHPMGQHVCAIGFLSKTMSHWRWGLCLTSALILFWVIGFVSGIALHIFGLSPETRLSCWLIWGHQKI